MVKQKINIKIVAANFQMNLSANKSKPLAQFQQKALNMFCQLTLHFHLSARHICSEKVKQIGIFEYLINHIRICWRKCFWKIIYTFA
mgnify:FL=1